ncbi:MAG: T9SS type A sorting domain-containing protein [Bacteroidetes bacterium]|nr:T9SS type A sorting domain-containing protein [Bacteroidota bacterium]
MLAGHTMNAQVTVKIDTVPRYYTPLLDDIYIAGDFNGWNAGDQAYKLTKSGNVYSIQLNLLQGAYVEYKFTRGDWSSVETQTDGTFLPNRNFTVQQGMTVIVRVANWTDMMGWHTSCSNTNILDLDFYMPQLDRTRRIWICLPKNYHFCQDHYPVLYMHDGQNLFDEVYAPYGEWNVDASMEALQSAGRQPAIVVGIDHGGQERMNEYSPWFNPGYGGGDGEAYADFIVSTLKPFIDNNFRTIPDRENTGIMGSSMGGLISFYVALKYQDVFSMAGIFSPSFWFSDAVYSFPSGQGHQFPMRIYFLCGDLESANMVSNMQDMYYTLLDNGFSIGELNCVVKYDGEHREWFWKREFPDAFIWLFEAPLTADRPWKIKPEILITYHPEQKTISINAGTHCRVSVFSMNGKLLLENNIEKSGEISVAALKRGMYIVSAKTRHKTYTQRFIR